MQYEQKNRKIGFWSVLLGKLIQTLEDTSLISTFSVVINIGLLGKKRLICYCVLTLYTVKSLKVGFFKI